MDKTTIGVLERTEGVDDEPRRAICTMCGKPLDPNDDEGYFRTKRCGQCRFELDTDSGPIPVL